MFIICVALAGPKPSQVLDMHQDFDTVNERCCGAFETAAEGNLAAPVLSHARWHMLWQLGHSVLAATSSPLASLHYTLTHSQLRSHLTEPTT